MNDIPEPVVAVVCDKCGESVPRENDAIELAIKTGEISQLRSIFAGKRHLLPTENCEGSSGCLRTNAGGGEVIMENFRVKIEGDQLVLRVNLRERHGLSSTGKTTRVASTDGAQKIDGFPKLRFNASVWETK